MKVTTGSLSKKPTAIVLLEMLAKRGKTFDDFTDGLAKLSSEELLDLFDYCHGLVYHRSDKLKAIVLGEMHSLACITFEMGKRGMAAEEVNKRFRTPPCPNCGGKCYVVTSKPKVRFIRCEDCGTQFKKARK